MQKNPSSWWSNPVFWFLRPSGQGASGALRSGSTDKAAPEDFNGPYSRGYGYNLNEGHTQPTPDIGAPALAWHIGVWPKRTADPTHSSIASKDIDAMEWDSLFDEFKRKREDLFAPAESESLYSVNRLLVKLQKAGRLLAANRPPEQFRLALRRWHVPDEQAFPVLEKPLLAFTLWWLDGAQQGFSDDAPPPPEAIRVRVHVQAHFDHMTMSFFIDPGQTWEKKHIYHSDEAVGERRQKIFSTVERIKTICQTRLENSQAELPPTQEQDLGSKEKKALLDASNYLYARIWEDFCASFGFSLEDVTTEVGRCFVNTRTLLISTDGIPEDGDHGPRPAPDATAWPGKKYHRFGQGSQSAANEANQVIKAFWPFIRRMDVDMDLKDHVACGLMDWRTLFVTSLAVRRSAHPGADWALRREEQHLPRDEDLRDMTIRNGGFRKLHPARYLFITKYEPHRRQIGRIVDRINRLATIRLYALKDWDVIRNADTHIRLRGQELDSITSWWSSQCGEVDNRYKARKAAIESRFAGKTSRSRLRERQRLLTEARVARDDSLCLETDRAEKRLITIASALDQLGRRTAGGLPYRINRSIHYIREFETLVKTLHVGAIPTWIAYNSFAERGLKPIFDFITQTGARLKALRERLTSVTESIQTSALVVQISATRENTDVLKQIELILKYGLGGAFVLILSSALKLSDLGADLFQFVVRHLP